MRDSIYSYLLTLLILASSCHDYTNKTHYELKTGETFELYFDQNSCCQNCFINKTSIRIVELIDERIIESGNCDGCSGTIAWTFKALSKGTDTLRIQELSMSEKCDLSLTRQPSTYTITIE